MRGQSPEETRPTRARIELRFTGKERQAADHTDVHTDLLVVQQNTAERRFSARLLSDAIRIRIKFLCQLRNLLSRVGSDVKTQLRVVEIGSLVLFLKLNSGLNRQSSVQRRWRCSVRFRIFNAAHHACEDDGTQKKYEGPERFQWNSPCVRCSFFFYVPDTLMVHSAPVIIRTIEQSEAKPGRNEKSIPVSTPGSNPSCFLSNMASLRTRAPLAQQNAKVVAVDHRIAIEVGEL